VVSETCYSVISNLKIISENDRDCNSCEYEEKIAAIRGTGMYASVFGIAMNTRIYVRVNLRTCKCMLGLNVDYKFLCWDKVR
jgi:hypothetical protein